MTERMLPGPHVCATCRRALTALELPSGEVTWHHGFGSDHPIVAVPRDDGPVVGVCDFCSEPDTGWVAECTPFLASVPVPGGVVNNQDDGAWAACDSCATYIQRGDWGRLLYRAEKHFDRATGMATGGFVALLHDQFRQHYTGTITRTEPPSST